jgi:hypothetical protein
VGVSRTRGGAGWWRPLPHNAIPVLYDLPVVDTQRLQSKRLVAFPGSCGSGNIFFRIKVTSSPSTVAMTISDWGGPLGFGAAPGWGATAARALSLCTYEQALQPRCDVGIMLNLPMPKGRGF